MDNNESLDNESLDTRHEPLYVYPNRCDQHIYGYTFSMYILFQVESKELELTGIVMTRINMYLFDV